MNALDTILEQYKLKNKYNLIKSEESVKVNNTIKYKSIPDLFCLVANKNIKRIDTSITKRGIMVDVSRGKVLKIETIKELIVKSMFCGFNYMTIYIEDLLNVNEFDQYGYLRGRYKDDEIKELVQFANNLEYKLIPGIQTLGHLENVLRWDSSDLIKGTDYVLNTDVQETYDFIEHVIDKVVYLFGTNSINIGMDEAFDLGFWRKNLESLNQKEIFLNHLSRVTEICKSKNIENIKIWSDMVFSIHSNTDGDKLYSNKFNEEISRLDDNVEIIYWNYWTKNSDEYSKILKLHKKFSNRVSMALSIHTSMNLFYDHTELECTKKAIPACIENQVSDILFTMWSEDGGICNYKSVYFGMYETMCEILEIDRDYEVLKLLSNTDYESMQKICSIKKIKINPMAILWNDPIYDLYYRSLDSDILNDILVELSNAKIQTCSNDIEDFYNNIINYIELDLLRYLNRINEKQYKDIIILYDNIYKYVIKEWFNEAKLYGIEDVQKRFELKLYRYKFASEYNILEENKLKGNIKPRFIQLYSPNRWL